MELTLSVSSAFFKEAAENPLLTFCYMVFGLFLRLMELEAECKTE